MYIVFDYLTPLMVRTSTLKVKLFDRETKDGNNRYLKILYTLITQTIKKLDIKSD